MVVEDVSFITFWIFDKLAYRYTFVVLFMYVASLWISDDYS